MGTGGVHATTEQRCHACQFTPPHPPPNHPPTTPHAQVITGRGRHSLGGQARVLPAVVRFLSDAGYQFDTDPDNVGVVNVMIDGS